MLLRIVLAVAVLAAVLPMARAPTAQAASPTDIETAVTNGLAWLAAQQKSVASGGDGHFESPTGGLERHAAATCLALVKFEHRGWELFPPPDGQGPFDPRYAQDGVNYYETVGDGLKYMLQQMRVKGNFVYVVPYPLTDPRYVNDGYVYDTGICMMAVAGTQHPNWLVGVGPVSGMTYMTYRQVLQGMLNWMADAQNVPSDLPTPQACAVGGWGYTANDYRLVDNSNTGYATLGIGFAISPPPYGFGLTIPASVTPNLLTFIRNIRNPASGGSVYRPCEPNNTSSLNILKTGNLLYEMKLVGWDQNNPTVKAAVDYIGSNWSAAPPIGWQDALTNKGYYQAMFLMMKGLEVQGVNSLKVGTWTAAWFPWVSDYIFAHAQTTDPAGWYWTGTGEGAGDWVLETSWALLTLEKVVAVPPTPTPVAAVGGIVGLPALAETSPAESAVPAEGSGWSPGAYAALAGVGALALVGVAIGGWYVRRRLPR